jgi:adenine phosphoribosyltransferase
MFRDITTLLGHPGAFVRAVDEMAGHFKGAGATKVVGIESRGFIFASAIAYKLGAGLVPVRKPKKLPAPVLREEYVLEYGTDALEIHADAIVSGERVLLVDDLLATGGTIGAACKLVERTGGIIGGIAFLIELDFLHGRDRLTNYRVESLIHYKEE